jgi:lysyl-tRNA synthetase class 1
MVTQWDGERVFYECRPDLVAWAKGCGHSGWVSPFGGRAKLPWNLEWAAQWALFGVTIEPNGKDLATAGGSRDRSEAIAREVFENEPPLNFPYEFLNIGGKKMSTSKGRGVAAHEIVEAVPPEQLRFLFLRHRPNHALEFDPDGTDQIPRLFDDFDKFAAATAGRQVRGDLPPGHESTFRYSLLDPDADVAVEAAAFRPAFGHLAMLIQLPEVDVVGRVEAEKGSPLTDHERALLDQRAGAARVWLETYAPESARLTVHHEAVPPTAAGLHEDQRAFLAQLADRAERDGPVSGDAWQALIFAVATDAGLPGRRAFEAIYRAFLGRTNGPRAGWLLASLDPVFVRERAREASGWTAAGGMPGPLPVGG